MLSNEYSIRLRAKLLKWNMRLHPDAGPAVGLHSLRVDSCLRDFQSLLALSIAQEPRRHSKRDTTPRASRNP